jgi:hypothetical protein
MVRRTVALALHTLEYARRPREAGFSEQQAEGQARALAAAMTDSLATKEDLRELSHDLGALETRVDARFARVDARFAQIEARLDAFEKHFDVRLLELEKRFELRLAEHGAHLDVRLADLERRITFRLGGLMVASRRALGSRQAALRRCRFTGPVRRRVSPESPRHRGSSRPATTSLVLQQRLDL